MTLYCNSRVQNWVLLFMRGSSLWLSWITIWDLFHDSNSNQRYMQFCEVGLSAVAACHEGKKGTSSSS
jgi:hypothetical protein